MTPYSPFRNIDPQSIRYANETGTYKLDVELRDFYFIMRHKGFIDDDSMIALERILRTVFTAIRESEYGGEVCGINNITHLTGGTKESRTKMKRLFRDVIGKSAVYAVGAKGMMKSLGRVFAALSPKTQLYFYDTEPEAILEIEKRLARVGSPVSTLSEAVVPDSTNDRVFALERENRELKALIEKRSQFLLELAGRVTWDDEFTPFVVAIPEEDPFYDAVHAMEYMQNDIREMLTSLKQAKREADEANRAKTRFLASMSHDLRTPLNGILGMIGLAQMSETTREQRQEYLSMAEFSAQSLLNLLNELLDFSKIETGHFTLTNSEVAIKKLLRSLVNPFEIQAGKVELGFSLHIDGNIPDVIVCDRVRISQMVTNLLHNALKFTHRGEIQVHLTATRSQTDEPQLSLIVSDTGIGIPASDLERIFIPFIQVGSHLERSYEGSGLGLAITHELVTLMGGTITVRSALCEGSTFTLTLPLKTPHPAQA
ncbi:hypothetical protein KJ865_03555 [Myxococcota bacterium]|nr:hypothetical protein [Myxococcota bacterium]